jgi:charged multivesicular body protein 6
MNTQYIPAHFERCGVAITSNFASPLLSPFVVTGLHDAHNAMGGIFSNSEAKKQPRRPPGGSISDLDRAVLDLKNARDRLTRYKQKLQQDKTKLLQRAKEAKERGDTQRALGLLRLRRYKEREMENVEGQLLTVLQMVGTIDSKQNEKELLAALKTGKDALAKMHQETTIEDILTLMDEVQEQNEIESEINHILKDVPSLSTEDEQAVEAELAALQESLQEPLELPQVPITKLSEAQAPAPKVPSKGIPETRRVAVPS